jgi:hypothetical protein
MADWADLDVSWLATMYVGEPEKCE